MCCSFSLLLLLNQRADLLLLLADLLVLLIAVQLVVELILELRVRVVERLAGSVLRAVNDTDELFAEMGDVFRARARRTGPRREALHHLLAVLVERVGRRRGRGPMGDHGFRARISSRARGAATAPPLSRYSARPPSFPMRWARAEAAIAACSAATPPRCPSPANACSRPRAWPAAGMLVLPRRLGGLSLRLLVLFGRPLAA